MLFLEPDVDCFRIDLHRVSLPDVVMQLQAPTTAPCASSEWEGSKSGPLPAIAYVGSVAPNSSHRTSPRATTLAGRRCDDDKTRNQLDSSTSATCSRAPGQRPAHAYEHVTMAERADAIYRALLSTLQYRFPYELPDTLEHVYILVITHMASPTFAGQPLGAEDVAALTTQAALKGSPHHFLPAELRYRTFPSHMNCLLEPTVIVGGDEDIATASTAFAPHAEQPGREEAGEADKPPRPTTRVTASDSATADTANAETVAVTRAPPQFFDSYYLLARDLTLAQQETYRQCCYRANQRRGGLPPTATATATGKGGSAASGLERQEEEEGRPSLMVGEHMTGFSVAQGKFVHYVLADGSREGDTATAAAGESRSSKRSRLDGESRTLSGEGGLGKPSGEASTPTPQGMEHAGHGISPQQQRRVAARSLHFSVYRIPLSRFEPEQQLYYTKQREGLRSRQYFRDRRGGGSDANTAQSRNRDPQQKRRHHDKKREKGAYRAKCMLGALLGKAWGGGHLHRSNDGGGSEEDDDATLFDESDGDDEEQLGLWMTDAEKEAARQRDVETHEVFKSLFAAELPERFPLEEAESAGCFFQRCHAVLTNYIASRLPYSEAKEEESGGGKERVPESPAAAAATTTTTTEAGSETVKHDSGGSSKAEEGVDKTQQETAAAVASNGEAPPPRSRDQKEEKAAGENEAPRPPVPAGKRKGGGPSAALLARLNAKTATGAAALRRRQEEEEAARRKKREEEDRQAKALRTTVEDASRHLEQEAAAAAAATARNDDGKDNEKASTAQAHAGVAGIRTVKRPRSFPGIAFHGVTRLLYSLVPCDCYHMVVSDANPLYFAQSSRAAYRAHTVSLGLISDLSLVDNRDGGGSNSDGCNDDRHEHHFPSGRPSYAKPISSTRTSLLQQQQQQRHHQEDADDECGGKRRSAQRRTTFGDKGLAGKGARRSGSPGPDASNAVLLFPLEDNAGERASRATRSARDRDGRRHSDGLVQSNQPSRAASPDRPSSSNRGSNEDAATTGRRAARKAGRERPAAQPGATSFSKLTSSTDGFLLVTTSLCCNNISGNPKHKKESLGEKGISLPSYMTGGEANLHRPGRCDGDLASASSPFTSTADNGYANAVVNLFSILSKSSLAQHKLRYGVIRPVVSVAVLEESTNNRGLGRGGGGGGGAHDNGEGASSVGGAAATAASGMYGEGSLQSRTSSTFACRGLMDHTWFSLPVQHTPEEQEAIQWMPVVLGATDCVSDVGYRSAVHLGIFPSEEKLRERSRSDGGGGGGGGHGDSLSPLFDGKTTGVLPSREAVEVSLRPDLAGFGVKREVGHGVDGGRSGTEEAAARAAGAADAFPENAAVVKERRGGIALTLGFEDDKNNNTNAEAPSRQPEKPRQQQTPPPSSLGAPPRTVRERLAARARAAQEAKAAATRTVTATTAAANRGGVAFELKFDDDDDANTRDGEGRWKKEKEEEARKAPPVRRATGGIAFDDIPLPRPGEQQQQQPPPQRCNPWDDVPVGGGEDGRAGRANARERTLTPPPPLSPFAVPGSHGSGGRAGVHRPPAMNFDDVPVGGAAAAQRGMGNAGSDANHPLQPCTPCTTTTAAPSASSGGVGFGTNGSRDEVPPVGRRASDATSGPPTRPQKKTINWDDVPVGGASQQKLRAEAIVKEDDEGEPFFDEEVSGFGRLSRRPEGGTRMSHSFRSPVRRSAGGNAHGNDGGGTDHRFDSPTRGAIGGNAAANWRSPGPSRPTTMMMATPTAIPGAGTSSPGAFANPFSSLSRLSTSDRPAFPPGSGNGLMSHSSFHYDTNPTRRGDSPAPHLGGAGGGGGGGGGPGISARSRRTPSVHPYSAANTNDHSSGNNNNNNNENPFLSPQRQPYEVRFSTNFGGTPTGRPTAQPYDIRAINRNSNFDTGNCPNDNMGRNTGTSAAAAAVRCYSHDPFSSPVSALSASGTGLGSSGRGAFGSSNNNNLPRSPFVDRVGGKGGAPFYDPHSSSTANHNRNTESVGWMPSRRDSFQGSRPTATADYFSPMSGRLHSGEGFQPGVTRDTLGNVANSPQFCINEYSDIIDPAGSRVRQRGTTAMDPVWSRPTAEFSIASNLRQRRQPPPPGTPPPPHRRTTFTTPPPSSRSSAADTRAPWTSGGNGSSYRESAFGNYAFDRDARAPEREGYYTSSPYSRQGSHSFMTSAGSALLGTHRPRPHRPPLAPRTGSGRPPLPSQRGILRRPTASFPATSPSLRSSFAHSAASRGLGGAGGRPNSFDDVPASAAARNGTHDATGDAFLGAYRFPPSSSSSVLQQQQQYPQQRFAAMRSASRAGVAPSGSSFARIDPTRLTPRERVALQRERNARARNVHNYECHLRENYMMGNERKRAKFESAADDTGATAAVDAWGLEEFRQQHPAAFAVAAANTFRHDHAGAADHRVDGSVLSRAQRELEEEAQARSMGLARLPGVPPTTYTDPRTGEAVPLGPGMAATTTTSIEGTDASAAVPATSRDERVLEDARRRRMVREGTSLEVMADAEDIVADGVNVSFTLRDIANAFLYMPSGLPPERNVCSGAWQSDGVSYFISSKPTRLRGGWESYLERLNLYQEPFYLRDRAFVMVLRVPHVPTLRVCVAVHNINDFIALLYQAPLAKILPTREEEWVRERQFAAEWMVDSDDEDDLVRTGKAARARGEYVEEDAMVETRWLFGLFTTRKRVTVRRKMPSSSRQEAQHGGQPYQQPQDVVSEQESDAARRTKCRKIRRQFMQEGLKLTWRHKLSLIYAQAKATLRSPGYHACTSPLLTDPSAFRSRMSFLSDRIVAYAAVQHRVNTLKVLRQTYIAKRAEELARSRVLRITDGSSAPFVPRNVSLGTGEARKENHGVTHFFRPTARSTRTPSPSSFASGSSPTTKATTTTTAQARGGCAMTFDMGTMKNNAEPAAPTERRRGGGVAFTLDVAEKTHSPGDASAARVLPRQQPALSSSCVNTRDAAVDIKRRGRGGIALTIDNSPVRRVSTPPPSASSFSRRATPRPPARSASASALSRTRPAAAGVAGRKREPFRVDRIGNGNAPNLPPSARVATSAFRPYARCQQSSAPQGSEAARGGDRGRLVSGVAPYHASIDIRPSQSARQEQNALVAQSLRDRERLDLVLHVQQSDSLAQALAKVTDSKQSAVASPLTTVLRLVPHQAQLVRGAGGGVVSSEDAPLYAGFVPTPVELHRQLEHYNISVSQLQQLLQWQWEHYQNSYELTPLPIFRGSVVPSAEDAFSLLGDPTVTASAASASSSSSSSSLRQRRSGARVPHWQGSRQLGITALSRVLLLSLVRWSWLVPVDYEGWWRGRRHGRTPRLNAVSRCFSPFRGAGGGGGGGPFGLSHVRIILTLVVLSVVAQFPSGTLHLLLASATLFCLWQACTGFLGIRRPIIITVEARQQARSYGPTGGLLSRLCSPLSFLAILREVLAGAWGKRKTNAPPRSILDADEVYLPPKDEQVTMVYRHAESTAETLLEQQHDFPRQILVTRLLQLQGLLCSLWSRTVLLLRGQSPVLSLLLAILLASYLVLFYAFLELVNALAAGRSFWLALFSPADALQAVVLPLLLENEQVVSQVVELLWQRVGGGGKPLSPFSTPPHPATAGAATREEEAGGGGHGEGETYQYYQNGKYYTYTTRKAPLATQQVASSDQVRFDGDHAPLSTADRARHTLHRPGSHDNSDDPFRLRKMRESFFGGDRSAAQRAAASMRALWDDVVSIVANTTAATSSAPHTERSNVNGTSPSRFARYSASGSSGRYRYWTMSAEAVVPFLLFAYVVTMCVPWSPYRKLWRVVWQLFLHDDALVRRPILSF